MTYKEFYDKYHKYAKISADLIEGNTPVESVLAFWYWETGRGTNRGTKEFNNLAGINYNRAWRNDLQLKPSPSGEYAIYSNLENFAKDYARVINLSMYQGVRQAFGTSDIADDVRAISASPYSVADYDFNTVTEFIKQFASLSGKSVPAVSNVVYDPQKNVEAFVGSMPPNINSGAIAVALVLVAASLFKK